MNHPNLEELSQRIHETNKAAGWWDIPRPRVQTAWLIVTELAEATEAERAGKYADLDALENEEDYKFKRELFADKPMPTSVELAFKRAFELHVKDTFEDEIAYAVIRLLDFSASEKFALNEPLEHQYPIAWLNEESFFSVSAALANGLRPGRPLDESINNSIMILCAVAFYRNFDLWKHVDLKLKYNATRPKMHGGKKF